MKTSTRKTRKSEFIVFTSLFLLSSLLTITANQNRGILNSDSEIWADRAGYYIYLPATFFYHFDVNKAPQGIDEKTGYGFTIDHKRNQISTQYYYGVSLLISPFFFIAHSLSALAGKDELGGFAMIYNKVFNIAAVFYLVLGLFFLRRFLKNYFTERLQYFIILVTYLGTNLFFYSIVDTLMSHVYSFFAFSVFLYAMKEFLKDNSQYRYFLLMSLAFALMLIIRPTNCMFGLIFPFWDVTERKEIIQRLKLIFRPGYLLPLLGIMYSFFIPQMIYWKFMHGSFLYFQYVLGFPYWNRPRIPEIWFSTLNGLVPWSPLILLFIGGMMYMIFIRKTNGVIIFSLFLLISYIASAYKSWYYGCGYGHRAFVEFYPIFCISFGFLAEKIFGLKKMILKISFVVVVICLTAFNFSLSLVANRCDYGSTWDWDYYAGQVSRIHLYPQSRLPYTFNNDFENTAFYNGGLTTDTIGFSGLSSGVLDKDHEACCEHIVFVRDFRGSIPKKITVQLLLKKTMPGPVDAFLVCSFVKGDTIYSMETGRIEPFAGNMGSWLKVFWTFRVPDGLSGDDRIKFYVWNVKRNSFFVDDLSIRYE